MEQNQDEKELDDLIASIGNDFMFSEWNRLDDILNNVTYSDSDSLQKDEEK